MKMRKKNEPSAAQLKQRKFYLALPVLIIPFVTLGFYALGGGKNKNQSTSITEGFNIELPSASEKNTTEVSKLEMYAQATRDSMERARQLKNDPYGSEFLNPKVMDEEGMDWDHAPARFPYAYDNNTAQERKIAKQLEALNRALSQTEDAEAMDYAPPPFKAATTYASLELDRLEQMMEMMNAETSTGDPEMEQINKTLETILDIQHPERVQERLQRISKENLGQVYAVASSVDPVKIGLLENVRTPQQNENHTLTSPTHKSSGFFGLLEDVKRDAEIQNAIEAVVHENQVLVSGSTVKLRLVSEIYINGKRIAAGSFVYGTASLKGERLEIAIESIRSENNLFPVALTVHDLDGLAGIRIPGAIARDVAKQSGAQTVSGISPTMFDPSIGAQVASAGIELSKNLLSKKIKLIKVEVKAGYQVLLRDKKQK